MTLPKKTPTPKPAPQEKRFRVTIITRKERITYEMKTAPDVSIHYAILHAREEIVLENGYVGDGLDGHLHPIDHVQRWIPLHMIEQVEVVEMREDGK